MRMILNKSLNLGIMRVKTIARISLDLFMTKYERASVENFNYLRVNLDL